MNLADENLLTEYQPFDDLSYAEAFSQLEMVVAALESGDHSLEESLALYERGKSLANYCANLLEKAELKIQQISGDQLQPFQTQ